MTDNVTAAGHGIAPPQRSLSEPEYYIIQQVRAFKTLHPASPLFGRRIARLVGRKCDESLQQVLDDLVRRQRLTHTEIGGYAAKATVLSHVGAQEEEPAPSADTGAFALL